MLGHYLKSATKDIQKLIELTETDIALIKEAKHDDVAQRAKIKNDLVRAFQSKKALLDNELIKRVEASGGKPLTDVLTKEEHAGLEAMKEALTTLHKINKEYAKYVVTISEFYNSLLDSMFPRESEGYQKSTPKPASILKVRA